MQERGADPGHAHGAVAVVADEGVAMETQEKGEGEGGMEESQTEESRVHSPTIKQEREDWSQPESHTPCLGQLHTHSGTHTCSQAQTHTHTQPESHTPCLG